jgi:hypothetical protein
VKYNKSSIKMLLHNNNIFYIFFLNKKKIIYLHLLLHSYRNYYIIFNQHLFFLVKIILLNFYFTCQIFFIYLINNYFQWLNCHKTEKYLCNNVKLINEKRLVYRLFIFYYKQVMILHGGVWEIPLYNNNKINI